MLIPKILRWTARILGTLFVLLILVFAVGEGTPNPSMLAPRDKLMFLALGVMLVGLVLAWKWAGLGGVLALAGYLLFVAIGGRRTILSPFMAAGVAACLHLLTWWVSDRVKWQGRGGLRRLGFAAVPIAGGLLIVWVWLGIGARSMQARSGSPPGLAGRWVGSSHVSDALLHDREVAVDITVSPDGTIHGQVGEASIVKGHIGPHLRANRINYLLSQMGEPSSRMVLELSGPPLVTPRHCLPKAHLDFNLRGGQLVGALYLTDPPMELRDPRVVLRRRDM
jgi:hypothetical protein